MVRFLDEAVFDLCFHYDGTVDDFHHLVREGMTKEQALISMGKSLCFYGNFCKKLTLLMTRHSIEIFTRIDSDGCLYLSVKGPRRVLQAFLLKQMRAEPESFTSCALLFDEVKEPIRQVA